MNKDKLIYVRWFLLRLILVVFDVIAINAALVLALFLRYYVAKSFHSAAFQYLEAYRSYAPFYTVFSILVFARFRLYSSMWRHAGLHDLNRIIIANVITVVAHVLGTLLFVRRMPISFYGLGAIIQLCLITASRFSYRLLLIEKENSNAHNAPIKLMVVGTDNNARSVLKQLSSHPSVQPVCVFSHREDEFGEFLDGVPIVKGVSNLEKAIATYKVNYVEIASNDIPNEIRQKIKSICHEKQFECQDYTNVVERFMNGVTLRDLLDFVHGPVEVVVDDTSKTYNSIDEAMVNTPNNYTVYSIYSKDSHTVIELAKRHIVLNDLSEDWVKDQEETTGEEVSFF